MRKCFTCITSISLALCATAVSALDLKQGHFLFEGGVYNATQGKTQNIDIETLVGNRFIATDRHDSNALFGLGYLVDGYKHDKFNLDYGVNLFYLAKTTSAGVIDQEHMFRNLAYQYKVSHLPLYATAKALIDTKSERFAFTVDAGLGPNFMNISDYHDISLDAMTLPDNAFSGRAKVTLSAMAGIGLRLNPKEGQAPIECGYRFFYLGQGDFNSRTDQILNNLKTGNNYAQALLCTVSV